MKTLLAVILVVFALFGAACSSGDAEESVVAGDANDASDSGDSSDAAPDDSTSDDPGDSDADSGDADDDSGDTDDASGSSSDGDEPSMAASSPIGAFFEEGGGFQQSIEDYTIKVEEMLVVCMAEQGFEFKQSPATTNDIERLQSELSTREWTETYGYGISTSFDSLVADQGQDPNSQIFLSMTPSERDAWIQTLAGPGATDPNITEPPPLEEQGCVGQAIIETGGQEVFENLESVGTTYEEGLDGIYDQPEMIDAIAAWNRCVTGAGFDSFSELDGPSESIQDRMDSITAPLNEAIDEIDPEEGQALLDGDSLELEDLPGLDVDLLRELQADEIALAVQDLDCREENIDAVFNPLRDAFETGLLDEYRSDFDALKNIGG